ncbi:M56 family metallopeptidase [Petrocella sp. FN5]|uniref:M56 family metallopeptidase n=1 Tax=Petrocella sp. FN5 TaxID=3032002 RepID=UPI0023DB56E9|nr:M56 family metallopeptidase [Petrocella sp. FN5]MDF1617902.1 M56 family metallopeptidase [Petrocella sp. FN5]
MRELFLSVINMSLTASYVILCVIFIRLLLKKAPKVISYALWGVIAFRLIIPFSFESMFSLIPRNINAVLIPHDIVYQQSPQVNSGIEVVDSLVSNSLPAPNVGASVNPLQIYTEIGTYIWILGIMVLLIYSVVSVLRLKRQLKGAQLIEQNIYHAQKLKTPFVLGLIRPRIYLPVDLSTTERSYILLHEQTHIQRKDHIIKILAFIILSIHWFNPLVWIAFLLMSTDMELSCDERVLKEMNEEIKKPYANSLLSLATGRHILNGSPLAFGEGNVKGRIINVLNYKKPVFWVVIVALITVIAVSVGLMSNPQEKQLSIEDYAHQFIEETIADYNTEDNYFKIIDRKITKLEKIASFDELLPATTLDIWSLEYRLKPEDISGIMLAGGMNEVDGWITEEASMGKPILVFSYDHSTPKFLGSFWSGEADFSTLAGQEMALRIFLETREMLPKETYSGNHIVIKFPASTGETYQLFLSQPVVQGEDGIWCVERWMDGNGTVYYVTPETDIKIADYYKALQKQNDEGDNLSLIDPLEVAIDYIKNDLGQLQVSIHDLVQKYSATIEDFMETPESNFIGFISNFEIDEYSKAFFHLDQIEWLTLDDTERLEALDIDPDEDMPGGFYIHNPNSYPMSFQVAEDAQYNIINWSESATHKSVSTQAFKEHLEQYYSDFVPPFRVVTKDGYVQSITEQYVP